MGICTDIFPPAPVKNQATVAKINEAGVKFLMCVKEGNTTIRKRMELKLVMQALELMNFE